MALPQPEVSVDEPAAEFAEWDTLDELDVDTERISLEGAEW